MLREISIFCATSGPGISISSALAAIHTLSHKVTKSAIWCRASRRQLTAANG